MKCIECEGREAVVHDPRDPPYEVGACLCRECAIAALDEQIEELIQERACVQALKARERARATAEDMARDAMRWHDEAQAEKMSRMNGRLSVDQLANRLRSIIGEAEQQLAQRNVPSIVERMAWYRTQAEALLRDILG